MTEKLVEKVVKNSKENENASSDKMCVLVSDEDHVSQKASARGKLEDSGKATERRRRTFDRLY